MGSPANLDVDCNHDDTSCKAAKPAKKKTNICNLCAFASLREDLFVLKNGIQLTNPIHIFNIQPFCDMDRTQIQPVKEPL